MGVRRPATAAYATAYRGDGNGFTPNIDNLAREGMRFDCALPGAPWCTPFRGALLTGRYPHQTGVVANGCRLAPELPTVAHAFAAAGYHTDLRRHVEPGRPLKLMLKTSSKIRYLDIRRLPAWRAACLRNKQDCACR